MSRDRGTQKQSHDYGYGQVCDVQGRVVDGCTVSGANQEHGIVSCSAVAGSEPIDQRFPIGMQLRILPNHACATAAQFPEYHAVMGQEAGPVWGRFYGW
jgi:D-serine deaminase-like pyridoxal phosphate-dependent protein